MAHHHEPLKGSAAADEKSPDHNPSSSTVVAVPLQVSSAASIAAAAAAATLPTKSPPKSRSRRKKAQSQSPPTKDMIPLSPSFQPGKLDVICSRGKFAYNSPGNCWFRCMVEEQMDAYNGARTKTDKSLVVSVLVNRVRQANPEGGFVKNFNGRWYRVSERYSREKVGQQFRDLLHMKYKSSTKAKAEKRKRVQDNGSPGSGEHSDLEGASFNSTRERAMTNSTADETSFNSTRERASTADETSFNSTRERGRVLATSCSMDETSFNSHRTRPPIYTASNSMDETSFRSNCTRGTAETSYRSTCTRGTAETSFNSTRTRMTAENSFNSTRTRGTAENSFNSTRTRETSFNSTRTRERSYPDETSFNSVLSRERVRTCSIDETPEPSPAPSTFVTVSAKEDGDLMTKFPPLNLEDGNLSLQPRSPMLKQQMPPPAAVGLERNPLDETHLDDIDMESLGDFEPLPMHASEADHGHHMDFTFGGGTDLHESFPTIFKPPPPDHHRSLPGTHSFDISVMRSHHDLPSGSGAAGGVGNGRRNSNSSNGGNTAFDPFFQPFHMSM